VRPSRGARLGLLGLLAVATVACLFASQPAPQWRALGVLLALGLGWTPARTIFFGRGRHAVRAIEWRSDGTWWIGDGRHPCQEADLQASTATLGPWILLVWRQPRFRRRYALMDAGCIGAATFRALKGRLRIEAGLSYRRTVDDN